MNIAKTLNERGSRYGDFKTHAEIAQRLKEILQEYQGWQRLTRDQKECLEMIMHKIGRIINGDPNYIDNWHDITGYSTLVENILLDNLENLK